MGRDRQQALEADAEELRLAAQGDRAAAARLVDRNGPRLYSLARRMLGDDQAAEDVVQDSFLRLWRVAPRWRAGEAMVSTWLHRVALNLCYDRLRRKREVLSPDPVDREDESPGAEQTLLEAQLAARVRAEVEALPPRQRAAIVLCHYQELPGVEAAAVLEVSVEALESLLARGRRALRAALADSGVGGVEGERR